MSIMRRRTEIGIAILVLLFLCTIHAMAQTQCPSGCVCLNAADAKAKGYTSYCGGKQQLCGYDARQNPMYCWQAAATTTTPYPSCPSGCVCLPELEGKEKGYSACDGRFTLCNLDAQGRSYYCFELPATTTPAYTACPQGCTCMDIGEAEGKGYSYCGGRQVLCGSTATGGYRYCFQPEALCPTGCECMDPSTAAKMGISAFCGGEKRLCAVVAGTEQYCYQLVKATTTAPLETPSTTRTLPPVVPPPVTTAAGLPPCTISGRINSFYHDPATIRVRVQEMERTPGGCLDAPPFTCFPGGFTAKNGTEPLFVNVTPVYAGDLVSHLVYSARVNCTGIYEVIPVYSDAADTCEWRGRWEYTKNKPFAMNGSSESNYDLNYVSGDNRVPSILVSTGALSPNSLHRGEGGWSLSVIAEDPGGIQSISVKGNYTVSFFTSSYDGPLENRTAPIIVPVDITCSSSPCDLALPYRAQGKNISFDLLISACDGVGNRNTRRYQHTFPDEGGDLAITSVSPVQVVYDAPLVKGKGTAFRVEITSTYPHPVETHLRLGLPTGQWGLVNRSANIVVPVSSLPEIWGPVKIPANATSFAVMLPIVPEYARALEWDEVLSDTGGGALRGTLIEGAMHSGIYGPDVRIAPMPIADRVWFTAGIDPLGELGETNEGNNELRSATYEVVTTRAWKFYFVKFHGGEAGDCAPYEPYAQSGAKEQLEHLLAVFPIADSKIEYAFAPDIYSMRCSHNSSLTCGYTTEYSESSRGQFLSKIEDMAKESGFDFGVAIGCGGGGGASGTIHAVIIGDAGGDGDFILSHEFNHVVVPMGDIYNLDCYSSWAESYCELPDGRRFYCCYGQYSREKEYRRDTLRINPSLGCTVDCDYSERQCSPDCCRARCLSNCTRQGGTVYGSPDQRTRPTMHAAEGFWVNRWLGMTGKTYFMDGPSGNNWMTLRSTEEMGFLRGRDPTCPRVEGIANDGYLKLLRNPNFYSARDPEAILVRGTLARAGEVTLKPFIRLSSVSLDLEFGQSGEYYIVLYDAGGGVLGRAGFTPSFIQSDPGGGMLEETAFSYRVEWREGTARIGVENARGEVLASRIVSANPPEVQIRSPAKGATWEVGSRARIEWSGSDRDGDPLVYSIAMSPDNGKTWLPLAIDYPNTTFEITDLQMPAGDYILRVRATDGVNTGEATTTVSIRARAVETTTARAGDLRSGTILVFMALLAAILAAYRIRRM